MRILHHRLALTGPHAHPLWWLAGGAISLRMLLFLGRGDYLAFDEGWYLLLGRNLMTGDGFTLTGLRHIALSPLFPILAGATDLIVGNAIWAGRLVAAVTGGLLVVPCWFMFSRMGGRRTATIACILVAVMPSLAPFVVPFWIGWDLWVGAEPLLHLLLYTGIALALRGLALSRAVAWGAAGLAFGLAYLARPEAVITFGLIAVGLAAAFVISRRIQHASALLTFMFAFALVATPYWLYLHEITGRWTITGRDVAVVPSLPGPATDGTPRAGRPVENMLWVDDDAYAHRLYALAPGGEGLADPYWGIPVDGQAAVPSSDRAQVAPPVPTDSPPVSTDSPPVGEQEAGADDTESSPQSETAPGTLTLYVRALGVIVPPYFWPLLLIGVLARRTGELRDEMSAALPLLATSMAIATVVAVDPRTQLLIVPLAAFYVSRGIRITGVLLERLLRKRGAVRRGFATGGLVLVIVAALVGTNVRRLYLSLRFGSPHHLVGTANRQVGEALRRTVPEGEPIMSWHPAIALYARRDWRVLPFATFDRVVTYASSSASEFVVLSSYYPSPLALDQLPHEYLVLHVPRAAAGVSGWQLRLMPASGPYSYGELQSGEPLND